MIKVDDSRVRFMKSAAPREVPDWASSMNILAWLRQRKEYRELVLRDATDLVAQFGDEAYSIAGIRAFPNAVDDSRPPNHWRRVKSEIAKLQGIEVGLNSADRRELDR
ncbi:hypothetical protein [Methylovirgula sp. HY1]|uniref:hypothetical protein n=1 Tax=Methylovirgula sp. HY1 TaxID=2822761 RepID=UPI001C5AB2A4|nr:hypothetical protein [Methylovirgula sp. HY1]QXX76126.1 hypothetical protein MHY1_02961 [Methylovirgula sp. HY1]